MVDIAFLDQYAQKQWENVLYFMVASTAAFRSFEGIGDRLGNDTMTLLAGGGLITERGQKITRDGFEFVLKETSNQIWRILLVYLRLCEVSKPRDVTTPFPLPVRQVPASDTHELTQCQRD